MTASLHIPSHSSTERGSTVNKTTKRRELLRAKTFLHMPAVYDALGARLVEQAGFEAVYTGGYVTGASRAVTEPLLTMTEQVAVAAMPRRRSIFRWWSMPAPGSAN